jgi:hypothetical protein
MVKFIPILIAANCFAARNTARFRRKRILFPLAARRPPRRQDAF